MSTAEFEMVEELASLVKDNLSCKHLILSVEEALVNFLQDDTGLEGVLELQPMIPYQRMLLHRLADIYGFVHESVGEGDDRHLVLERCPESAIPSILVSDILFHYDECQFPTTSHNILRRKEAPEQKILEKFPSSTPFEEREAAYLAARERIFSPSESDEKELSAPRSRKMPVVARRMIAHALGAKICTNTSDQKLVLQNFEKNENIESPTTNQRSEGHVVSTKEFTEKSTVKPCSRVKKTCNKPVAKSCNSTKNNSKNGRTIGVESLEREQIGAAKRIFAHALGRPAGRGNCNFPVKQNEGSRASS